MDLTNLPQRDWNKKLEFEDPTGLRIFSVEPQAHLIGVTQSVGLLEGYSADAILVKAFEKNYRTASNPKVVESYGFEKKHGEPIELIDFVYECIFDRACEAEMNRYRHNSKNYESGRYVDYVKHGLTIVFPEDCTTQAKRDLFVFETVLPDLKNYRNAMEQGAKKQEARRRLGFYVAVESTIKVNLRSLVHMGTQRSAKYSPNGREAEPQISAVVTQMLEAIEPYLPHFFEVVKEQVGKGYR